VVFSTASVPDCGIFRCNFVDRCFAFSTTQTNDTNDMIYLDNNATTQVARVFASMQPYLDRGLTQPVISAFSRPTSKRRGRTCARTGSKFAWSSDTSELCSLPVVLESDNWAIRGPRSTSAKETIITTQSSMKRWELVRSFGKDGRGDVLAVDGNVSWISNTWLPPCVRIQRSCQFYHVAK